MSGDAFRDALAAALWLGGDLDVPGHCELVADAILAMPEMQELLAHERRLDAAVTLWGKALEDQAAHIATLTADLAAERAEVERLRAAGDALAEVLDTGNWTYDILPAAEAWREARRDR